MDSAEESVSEAPQASRPRRRMVGVLVILGSAVVIGGAIVTAGFASAASVAEETARVVEETEQLR
ncbi:MAG: hypothetical protein KKA40_01015 [Actinobacteria bacterium]|nr:hypothetical protein [Actinomycetota bacterium]MBU2316095.1 hypothetical protein [Actinomycetota bacterium]